MSKALRFPEDVRAALARTWRNHHQEWLADGGTWPLEMPLGSPHEAEAQSQLDGVRQWVATWQSWRGPGTLEWCERRWRTLGVQNLPERLVLEDAGSVAVWIGEEQRWERARAGYRQMVGHWPALAQRLPRYFDALAVISEPDLVRLEKLLAWIDANPRSGLYPRQIPLAGMDTKWLEARAPMVADLVATLRADDAAGLGFYERCGLKPAPRVVRVRLLDQVLRERAGGLGDIAAPVEELAALRLPVARAYIVENVQTGLCFGDVPGAVVFLGLGYGVTSLARVPWVAAAECIYWGDLDTHGFAILSGARASLPGVTSMLMDEATLLRNRELWVEEREQYHLPELPFLTGGEQCVYQGLKQQRWGVNVRLEQERIAWDEAWQAIAG